MPKCLNPYCHSEATKRITVRQPGGCSVSVIEFCENCAKEIWKAAEHELAVARGKARSSSLTPEKRKEIASKAGKIGGKNRWKKSN